MENEIKISLVDAEVTKLSLQPGDVLGVKISATDISDNALEYLQNMLNSTFPNNQIMMFYVKPTDNITFTKIETQSEGCGPGYCSNCNCGKKENALKQGEEQ